MGIKIDQETNTRPMEKELAQSDLPSKRKVPKPSETTMGHGISEQKATT